MKKTWLVAALILLVVSCQQDKQAPVVNAKLPVGSFTISTSRDTAITTPGGARLQIPAHAFSTNAATVQLSLQEAYNIQDMIRGGLTTMSGRQPLSSGGMINVMVNGASATFAKPIRVSIPTQRTVAGMQLFTGVAGADGTIDWQNPQPITTNEQIAAGKAIFERECASCHHQTQERTGPPLAYIGQRRNAQWLYSFIRNNTAMIADIDYDEYLYRNQYASYLYCYYNKAAMPAYPDLTDEQLDALITYLNEPVDAVPVDHKKEYDSCVRYENAIDSLNQLRGNLIRTNTQTLDVPRSARVNPASFSQVPEGEDNFVIPPIQYIEYYTFDINMSGWYNVDILFKNIPGWINSNFTVRITGLYTDNAKLFFLLPEQKVYLEGGPLPGKENVWGFFEKNGDIPLPQGVPGYIYLIGNSGDSISFASAMFTTQTKLELTLTAESSDTTTINRILNTPGFSGFSARIGASQIAPALRTIDSALKTVQYLKPVNCRCECVSNYVEEKPVRESPVYGR